MIQHFCEAMPYGVEIVLYPPTAVAPGWRICGPGSAAFGLSDGIHCPYCGAQLTDDRRKLPVWDDRREECYHCYHYGDQDDDGEWDVCCFCDRSPKSEERRSGNDRRKATS